MARHEAIESGRFRGERTVQGGGTLRLMSGGYVDGVPQAERSGRWQRLMMAGELMALGFDAVNIPYARRRVVWGLRLVAFWSWA